MPKLPIISGKKATKVFLQEGYVIDHQTGSHVILYKHNKILTIPNHKELARGTLRAIIKQAGLTREEFMKKLR